MNEKHLDRYAKILVEHALDLRPGQRLDIWGELTHRDFALRVGEAAYDAKAGQVAYHLVDPLETAQLIRRASPEQIILNNLDHNAWLSEALCARGAFIILVGKSDPESLPELQRSHPQKHQLFTAESGTISLAFARRVVDQRLSPAVAAVCPTPAWAQKVFPELTGQQAYEKFWQLVCEWVGADRDDAPAHAENVTKQLEARARRLDALEIRELHVCGGGCDLRIGLSEKSRWHAGFLATTSGQRFLFNFPSFEVFTTPDRRLTEGRLVASRPLRLRGGVRVEGLTLELRTGRVVDFSATQGFEPFARWLEVDEGASYLGEIALVDEGSPIARCGRSFEHMLVDENAASHLALGQGFAHTLERGNEMTPSQLEEVGCNRSSLHTDIAFGSSEVDVVATRSREGEVVLLERGRWVM